MTKHTDTLFLKISVGSFVCFDDFVDLIQSSSNPKQMLNNLNDDANSIELSSAYIFPIENLSLCVFIRNSFWMQSSSKL